MVQFTTLDQADVVFLVEGTAINGAYINDMKLNYIVPTLEYFSQTEEDVFSVDKSNVMYAVVCYRTAQAMPGTCCKTYGPYTSTQKLVNAIDNLELTGGKSESYANLAEGMSVALHCFEDFNEVRGSQRGTSSSPSTQNMAQKHCIMVCNSAPYSMPVSVNSNQPLDMKNYEQLAAIFHENNINLSIISPRKIPILFKIFEKAGGDLVNNTKNYSKDPRHLVLLKGYSLKERPISPTVANAINISSPLQNATAAIPNPGSMDANSGMNVDQVQQQQQQQANMRPTPDYQFQMNNQNIRPNMMGNQPGQPNQIQQPVGQQGQMAGNVPGNVNMFNNNNANGMMTRPMGPNVARRMPGPGGIIPQQQQGQMQGQVPQQQQQQQMNMGQMQQNSSVLISQLNVMPNQNQNQNIRMPFNMNPQQQQPQPGQSQQVPQQQQQQQQPPQPQPTQREKIWTGVLEYTDKPNRVTRQISVVAHCAVKNGEPDIKADNWPAKLPMQVMPKSTMQSVIGQFAKDSKSMFFHTTSTEGMECFQQGTNAGYITFKNCNELRVAIVLYLPDRKQMIGLIPNNQTAFMERLRKVYTDQQAQQAALQQQQQQQQQQMQQQQQQQGMNQQGNNMMEAGVVGGDVNGGGNNQQMQMQQQMVNQQQQQNPNDGQFRNFPMNPQQQQQQQQQMPLMNEFNQGPRMIRPVMANNQMQGNMNPQQQQQGHFQMNPQMQQGQMGNPQMMNDFVPMQQQQQRMVRPQNNQLRHLLQRQPQFNPGMQGVNPQQAAGIQQQNPNVNQMQQQQQNFDGFDF